MNKNIVIAGGVLIVAAAAAVLIVRNARSEPDDRIRISGNIELTEVDVAFKYPGKLMERTVDEGDRVQKGDIVARLDREQLLKQKDRDQAALGLARAQLTQAQTAVRWQQQAQAADVDQRSAELNSVRARLQELRTGSRPQEIQEAKAAVDSGQSEFERARNDWDRAQTLFKNDDISRSQFDQYRSRFETSESALNQAKQRLSLVEAGPRSEVVEAAGAQVARAQAGVRAAEANQLEVQRRRQELPARQAEIERAQAQIAMLQSQLDDTVAAAPSSGIVLTKAAEVGEVLAAGTTVLTIGDLQHPWVRGYIPERDLGKVKIGSKARITTDSFPGKEYTGKVSFIASEAEFTPKQIQTADERVKLVYRVKIDVENPNQELKLNMPVDVEILLER